MGVSGIPVVGVEGKEASKTIVSVRRIVPAFKTFRLGKWREVCGGEARDERHSRPVRVVEDSRTEKGRDGLRLGPRVNPHGSRARIARRNPAYRGTGTKRTRVADVLAGASAGLSASGFAGSTFTGSAAGSSEYGLIGGKRHGL